ncbi:MAG TPA: hypothetical protein VF980_05415 [Thermoanaerobaculia bacterium]
MRYRVKRTRINKLGKEATLQSERGFETIEAATAEAAASEVIRRADMTLIGRVEETTGNSAVATSRDSKGNTVVIRVFPEPE